MSENRTSLPRAAAGVALLTLLALPRGRRGWAALLLLGFGPALAGVTALVSPQTAPTDIFRHVAFYFTDWIALWLLAAVFGLSLTTGEIEEGTAGYVLLAALPKWAVLAVQLAVTAVVLSVLLGASLIVTALAAGGIPNFWRSIASCTLVAGAGLLVALPFAATCGLAFRSPGTALAAVSLPVIFGEFLVTHWPIRLAAWTVTNNLRALLLDLLFEGHRGPLYRYVKNFRLPEYRDAALFLASMAGIFLATTMIAAMNRPIDGREAR